MTTFNYKKWVTDYKQGKPLFEQTTGSYTGSYSTGSFTGSYSTGSYTGSYTGSSSTGSSSTGSSATGSGCVINQSYTNLVVGNPQLGDHGINQNFVNNMQGKPNNFYQNRIQAFSAKWDTLVGNHPANPQSGQVPIHNGFEAYCQGENPNWQIKLANKRRYANNCINNPGSC